MTPQLLWATRLPYTPSRGIFLEHQSGCITPELPAPRHLGVIAPPPPRLGSSTLLRCRLSGLPSLTEGPAPSTLCPWPLSPSELPSFHLSLPALLRLLWTPGGLDLCPGCPGARRGRLAGHVHSGVSSRTLTLQFCVWPEPRTEAVGRGLRLEVRGGLGLHPPRTAAMWTHLGLHFPGCETERGPRAEGVQ